MIDKTLKIRLVELLEKYQKFGYYRSFDIETVGNRYTNVILFEPNFNINNIMELLDFFKTYNFYLWSVNTHYIMYTDDSSD